MTIAQLPPRGILGELADTSIRQSGALGGGLGHMNLGAGDLPTPEPAKSIWIRLTGGPLPDDRTGTSVGAAAYSWEFVWRRDRNLFTSEEKKGSAFLTLPAFEMNNFANVPLGSVVRAFYGGDYLNPALEFVYEPGVCCEQNGGGGGGGTDPCCGFWGYDLGGADHPSRGWLWYTWVPGGPFGLQTCSQVIGWVHCFISPGGGGPGQWTWVPPDKCNGPRDTLVTAIVPCGTPAPASPPVGGLPPGGIPPPGGTPPPGGGTGVLCNPCNPATDNPCYNCGGGKFCSNWQACFNSAGSSASAPRMFGSSGFGRSLRSQGLAPTASSGCACGGSCGDCGGASPNPVAQAMPGALLASAKRFGGMFGRPLGWATTPVDPSQFGLPALTDNDVIVGASDGSITKLTLADGQVVGHTGGVLAPVDPNVGLTGYTIFLNGVGPTVSLIISDTDTYVAATNSSGFPVIVNLPATPTAWRRIVIKDNGGNAGAKNWTVTPASGTIDGGATFVMNANYQSVELIYNGGQWNII